MNYLELYVYRPSGTAEEPHRAVATVLSAGRDLFSSLEAAVFELRRAGWAVDDVKKFVTSYQPDVDQGDDRLTRLSKKLGANGLEWFVTSDAEAAVATA